MTENPDHDREEVPGLPAISPENTREQAREGNEQRAGEGGPDYEAPPFLPEASRAPVSNHAEFPWMGDEGRREREAVYDG